MLRTAPPIEHGGVHDQLLRRSLLSPLSMAFFVAVLGILELGLADAYPFRNDGISVVRMRIPRSPRTAKQWRNALRTFVSREGAASSPTFSQSDVTHIEDHLNFLFARPKQWFQKEILRILGPQEEA